MIKKLAVITLSSILLGGCTLGNMLKPGDAAKDAQMEVVASPVPTPDTSLQAMPTTSTSSDDASLESDINSTTILDEDFTDLN